MSLHISWNDATSSGPKCSAKFLKPLLCSFAVIGLDEPFT
jgi:hypothetical protein